MRRKALVQFWSEEMRPNKPLYSLTASSRDVRRFIVLNFNLLTKGPAYKVLLNLKQDDVEVIFW
jgi:hypothetical protein